MTEKLGLSGGIARRFQNNALTPLLAVTALLMGLFAGAITPREEEPQIDVTLANVFVPFPGASTTEVENLVAIPMEQVLSEIGGVKHHRLSFAPRARLTRQRRPCGVSTRRASTRRRSMCSSDNRSKT